MQVLLLKDVAGIGHAGDIKEVSGGHAKNYLLPKKLAVPASEGAQKQAQSIREATERRHDRKLTEAKGLATKINGQVLTFKMKAGEGDRLYGSVTNGEIAEALSKVAKIEIERRQVELEHPIKALGQHNVLVKVASGVSATIVVTVEREAEPHAPESRVPGGEES
jgi:large subunit ribosomal protein L9